MPLLDANTTAQLKTYLGNLRRPIELVASLDASPKAAEMRALVEEVAAQSDLVTVRFDGDDARQPSFAIRADDGRAEAMFAGIPMGHEFTSLVLALLQVGGHPVKLEDAVIEQIRNLDGDYQFETYFRCRARTARKSSRH
jgi:alkyl hydroperoxide reductase subunit F